MSLYIEQQGAGPDMVLVHGWGMHGGIWGDLTGKLAERYRVTSIDLPGHGRSHRQPGPYDLERLADVVAQPVPGPAVWLGWSLGGLIAMTIALRHPQQVDRLVLVNATPRFVQGPDWSGVMSPALLTQFTEELAQDYRATLLRFLSLQIGMDAADRALLRTLRSEMFRHGEPDPQALIAGLAILRDADLRDALPQITCPTLIIHGLRDRLASSGAADYLQKHLRSARLAPMDAAGHAPFLSHPEHFRELLREFL